MRYDISSITSSSVERFRTAKSLCRRADRSQQAQKTSVYTPQTVTVPRVKMTDRIALTTTDLFAANMHPTISGQKKIQGDAQVTSVSDILSGTDEMSDVSSDIKAGASLHAPDLPLARKRGMKKNPNRKGHRFCLRMPDEMWARLRDKTDALETYPSSYALELIAADLCLPTEEYRATRNKYLKKAFADLRIAFDDCGTNINQMAKAANSGKPCPLTRPEINQALADFARGCRVLESLRP